MSQIFEAIQDYLQKQLVILNDNRVPIEDQKKVLGELTAVFSDLCAMLDMFNRKYAGKNGAS
jgi:hypothetical protein